MNGFLKRTLRGARLLEFGALTVVLALALAVYMVKARAGRETGDISSVEDQITDEQRHLRLLQAEVAHLEQPARMQRLAEAAGLGPAPDDREITLDRLPDVARQAEAPVPAPATDKAKPAPATPAAQTGGPQ